MAVPVCTRFGNGNNKTAGTTLSLAGSSTLAVGDYVLVTLAMDQAAGAVSAAISGTAVIGAWTVDQDVSNGSGTAGTRFVATYAKCATAGTITGATVTHPSVTARAGETSKVTGADGTTPILFSGVSASAAPNLGPVTAGLDLLILGSCAQQAAGAGAVQSGATGLTAGWSATGNDLSTTGTTGGGATSNISTAMRFATRSPSVAESPFCSVTSTADQWYDSIWRAPSGASPLTLNDRAGTARAADPADTLALGLTKTDAPTGSRAGAPKETLSLPTATPLTLTDRPTGSRSAGSADSPSLGLTLTDRPAGSRSGAPADVLTQGLTRTDSAGGARAGKSAETLSLAGGPLILTDRATAARAASPGDQLTLGLVKTDGATAARSGTPRETPTFGLTRIDTATGSRAGDPREALTLGLLLADTAGVARAGSPAGTLTLGVTLTDVAAAIRSGRPSETLSLTGAPLFLADRSGALRAAGAHETLSFGLTILDRPIAVRGGDGADLLHLGLTALDRPTAIRLAIRTDQANINGATTRGWSAASTNATGGSTTTVSIL